MADIEHEIQINAPQDRVYEALTNVSELAKWHTAKVEGGSGAGEVFLTRPEAEPVFEWKVMKRDPSQVEWKCVKGPGDAVGTTVRFDLSRAEDGRTFVEFVHAGWPDRSGKYRKCNTLWGVLLAHLRRYLETGCAEPALN
jgi:uncharacterized protein YndB with AHSA1/START domain